jgi:hypothetical protein
MLFQLKDLPDPGPFRFDGVAPGNYLVFAVPTKGRTPFRSADFISRYESRALKITVQKGKISGGLQIPYLTLTN